MADFCRQCTLEDGLPGGNYETGDGDLQGITSPEAFADDRYAVVMCEGCGAIQVDPQGNCISRDCLRQHGTRPPPP